jgi:hypothetical protein
MWWRPMLETLHTPAMPMVLSSSFLHQKRMMNCEYDDEL